MGAVDACGELLYIHIRICGKDLGETVGVKGMEGLRPHHPLVRRGFCFQWGNMSLSEAMGAGWENCVAGHLSGGGVGLADFLGKLR